MCNWLSQLKADNRIQSSEPKADMGIETKLHRKQTKRLNVGCWFACAVQRCTDPITIR